MLLDVNDEMYNEVTALIQYYDKMENLLKLVKEKNNKATNKEMKNAIKHQKALKGENII